MALAPKISQAEFEFLARRAGLSLSEKQKLELYGAYAHLEAMIERLYEPLPRDAAPATIFAIDRSGA
jgi:hypothetical protein